MYKNTLRNILFPILLALAVVGGMFLGRFFPKPAIGDGRSLVSRTAGTPAGADSKITRLFSMIHSSYIEEVSFDSITEVIMPMIMRELDPHSTYIPAQRFERVNEELIGEIGGIGVKFTMLTDTALVQNVVAGGPSEAAGLLPGDRIIEVDGKVISGQRMYQDDVLKLLRGKPGSTVELGIERGGEAELLPFTVTRAMIGMNSVAAAFQIVPGVAYIKLDQFSRVSDKEIAAALTRLMEEGADKMILDLRGNSGGYLDQAISISNDFLPGGKLIVYTERKNKARVEEFRSNGRGKFQDVELAILIDEQSASSSEILAGALQDNDRGTIIGRRSFGKGLVQEQVQFYDGSAVRLTIARYFTPTGRSIQKPYADADAYRMDAYERYMHNEYFTADSIRLVDSLKFTTPGGKTVYGGGGIMPDIFVPLDTTYMNNFYLNVLENSRNIAMRYALRYVDRHRARVNAIRTVPELNALLDSDPGMFDDFVAFARTFGVRPTQEELDQTRTILTELIRGYIGRSTVLDDVGFYANYYKIDQPILRAIEVLNGGGIQ